MDMQIEEYEPIEQAEFELESKTEDQGVLRQLYFTGWKECSPILIKISEDKEIMRELKAHYVKLSDESKELFMKTFNPKLSELINKMASSLDDIPHREFRGIMHFIKNLYVSSELLLPSQSILAQIEQVAKKCSGYECFLEVVEVIREMKGKTQFDRLYSELQAFFKRGQAQNGFKFGQTYQKLPEEKQLLVKFQIFDLLTITNSMKTDVTEKDLSQIAQILKDKPFHDLLKAIVKKSRCELTKELKNLVLKGKIICDFTKIDYRFETSLLHPELNHEPLILDVLKQMQGADLYRLFYGDCAVVEDSMLKVKWNLKILEKIEEFSQLSLQLNDFEGEIFTKILNLFKTVFDQRHLKLIAIEQTQSESYSIQYTCKLFQLVTQYYRKYKNNPQSANFGGINEHYLLNFAKQTHGWLQNTNLKSQPFLKSIVSDLYSFLMQAIFDQRDFQSISNPNSDLSKMLMKIMIASESLPLSWNYLKNVKTIIDKWGESIAVETDQFKTIIKMFFEAYLNKKVTFSYKIGSHAFNPVIISKNYNQMLGNELLVVLESFLKKMKETEGLLSHRGLAAKQFNITATKICLFLSSKIKFENIHKLAEVVYQLYTSYGHILPILYNFRFWLLQLVREQPDQNILPLMKETSLSFRKLSEALKEKDLPYCLSNSFREDAEIRKLVTEYISNCRILTNKMQLKRQKSELSEQFYSEYFIFIRQLIESYIQTKQAVINQSLLGQNQFKTFHLLNQLSDGDTIYNLVSEARVEAKIVVRYLICNSARLLSHREESLIMANIASILIQTINHKDQHYQRLNFFNEMVGFNKIKNKSVLQKKQILGALQRSHFMNRVDVLSLKLEDFVPVNIVAAFYQNIKPHFSQILKYIFQIKSHLVPNKISTRAKNTTNKNYRRRSTIDFTVKPAN